MQYALVSFGSNISQGSLRPHLLNVMSNILVCCRILSHKLVSLLLHKVLPEVCRIPLRHEDVDTRFQPSHIVQKLEDETPANDGVVASHHRSKILWLVDKTFLPSIWVSPYVNVSLVIVDELFRYQSEVEHIPRIEASHE